MTFGSSENVGGKDVACGGNGSENLLTPGGATDVPLQDPRQSAPIIQVLAYHPALWQYFRRKARDQNEIDDLIQEVFLRVLARSSPEPVHYIGAYIFQIAGSVLADRHRRGAVRQEGSHIEFDADRHGTLEFDAAHILECRQELRSAVIALQLLPERTREIFILRRVEGFALRDIADRYGISVSAVEKHVVRAIHHLVSST